MLGAPVSGSFPPGVGDVVGEVVGDVFGECAGRRVGRFVGLGFTLGRFDGLGFTVGRFVGLGFTVGRIVRFLVGFVVGGRDFMLGLFVGRRCGTESPQ